MGNICSGGKEEKKASPFTPTNDSDLQTPDPQNPTTYLQSDGMSSSLDYNNQQSAAAASGLQSPFQSSSDAPNATSAQNEAQLRQQQEEQNRLEVIVQMAGRGMVSVRSTRGSTGYYDQGLAAALGQHLEQTTTFADQLPIRLPPVSSKTNVKEQLSLPQWENVHLGHKGTGLAGCGGENPNTYMDHVAVSYLDAVVPKKERIFHQGVGPMVENLL